METQAAAQIVMSSDRHGGTMPSALSVRNLIATDEEVDENATPTTTTRSSTAARGTTPTTDKSGGKQTVGSLSHKSLFSTYGKMGFVLDF